MQGIKLLAFTESVNYLGRVDSMDGINSNPAKLDKIKQWPRPEKETGLASFLDFCNYYQNLIPSFAHISDPFYKVSRSDIIEWTKSLDAKFKELKQQLLQPRFV